MSHKRKRARGTRKWEGLVSRKNHGASLAPGDFWQGCRKRRGSTSAGGWGIATNCASMKLVASVAAASAIAPRGTVAEGRSIVRLSRQGGGKGRVLSIQMSLLSCSSRQDTKQICQYGWEAHIVATESASSAGPCGCGSAARVRGQGTDKFISGWL